MAPPPTYSATLPTYEFRYVAMAGVAAAALASHAGATFALGTAGR